MEQREHDIHMQATAAGRSTRQLSAIAGRILAAETVYTLGFGLSAKVEVSNARITPRHVFMGEKVNIAFYVTNASNKAQQVLVDFCIHYVKASGKTSAKVFKLKMLDLAPKQTVRLSKTVSTAEMTTRKHHAGAHRVDVLLNGQARAMGVFELAAGGAE